MKQVGRNHYVDHVPKEGEVWFKVGTENGRYCHRMRRVIAVVKDWVYFNDGGDKNGACKLCAFQEWMVGAHEVDREKV